MTKDDLIKLILGKEEISKTKLTQKEINLVIELFFETVKEALLKGEYIELRNFGSFMVRTRRPRVSWNPKKREKINIPEKKVPYFKPGTLLKKAINTDTAY